MKKPEYPLEQLVLIKKKKLEEAEKNLRDKKKALQAEEEKLKKAEDARNEVKEHRFAKLTQLREKMDEGAPGEKVQQMRYYLKEVDHQLSQKEQKVKEQQKHVETAIKNVELARTELLKKQLDLEKLRMHREEWDKEMHLIELHQEEVETDDMGSAMHVRKRSKKKKGSSEN